MHISLKCIIRPKKTIYFLGFIDKGKKVCYNVVQEYLSAFSAEKHCKNYIKEKSA